jgi:hypothetical protein
VVGWFGPGQDDHDGFVVSGGAISQRDLLVVEGADFTDPQDNNNLGQVVGWYGVAGYLRHGFLATPIAAADFDQDGDVDGADMALWQGDFGLTANGDADADGDTDGADFLVWQRQLGGGAPAAVQAAGLLADGGSVGRGGVPEPTALALGGAWLAWAALARSRRGPWVARGGR